ncbi:hypothetical protein [Devosia sp. DBB001]|nr:hypothetical protein [Devosia sp. DBB001]
MPANFEAMDARATIRQEELSAAQAKQQDEAVSKRREELTAKIKAEENWLSTPSYQRATATQEGQEGLDARLKAAPTNITTWKKELEELENGNALRVLEQSTKDRDGPILDLLKF